MRLTCRFQHEGQFVDFEDRISVGAFLGQNSLDENARVKLISQKHNLKTNFTLNNLQLELMGFGVCKIL